MYFQFLVGNVWINAITREQKYEKHRNELANGLTSDGLLGLSVQLEVMFLHLLSFIICEGDNDSTVLIIMRDFETGQSRQESQR